MKESRAITKQSIELVPYIPSEIQNISIIVNASVEPNLKYFIPIDHS